VMNITDVGDVHHMIHLETRNEEGAL